MCGLSCSAGCNSIIECIKVPDMRLRPSAYISAPLSLRTREAHADYAAAIVSGNRKVPLVLGRRYGPQIQCGIIGFITIDVVDFTIRIVAGVKSKRNPMSAVALAIDDAVQIATNQCRKRRSARELGIP
nr:hypothetical protein [Novosphingobium pentaromativorans]